MFSKVGRRLRAFIKDFWDISLGPIFDFIADRFMDAVEAWGDSKATRGLLDGLKRSLRAGGSLISPRAYEEFDEAVREMNPIIALISTLFVVPAVIISTINARMSAAFKIIEQQENIENRPTPPPVDLWLRAWNRRLVDDLEAVEQLKRYGFSDFLMEPMRQSIKEKLTLGDIAEAVRRGLLDYNEGAQYAKTAGFDEREWDIAFKLSQRLLTLAELVRATLLGVISYDDAKRRAGELGISEQDFDIALYSSRQLLTVGEYINGWLRGTIDDQYLDQQFAAMGISETDRQILKELAFFIPPPSDLIRMAVREVFTPEVAERFGQFQDFPEVFKEWAARQGISEFWARAYWAAHWDLPSITQGFEMFHREVITREELELLLRAQDVMPFWRDKLLQISYNPVTRVDILRMYQLGVIDRDEVERRFRHLGYSPEDARVLTEYTIRLAAQREKDLSRQDMEELLAAGVLTEEQAKQFLIRAGYTEEIANLILERTRLKIAQREMEDEIEVIKTRFLNGEITLQDVAAELQRLGATGLQVDKVMAELERARRRQRRALSPAQVERAFKRGLLAPDEARQRLRALGYADRDVDVLMDLWTREVTE
jgi:hypothetical protein